MSRALFLLLLACNADAKPVVATSLFSSKPEAVEVHSAAHYRALGPAGLEQALQTNDDALIDAVAQQRDARLSGLFWYTNLDEAKAAAKASGKPILSLRLLGRLTDEYSCANSRLFRTVLYPDPRVNTLMKEYVLHWSTEREVPQVEITFGDGRVVRRTITGNSVHYVLDADGLALDVIPGLLAPEDFVRSLETGRTLHASVTSPGVDRQAVLGAQHQALLEESAAAFRRRLGRLGGRDLPAAAGLVPWMTDPRHAEPVPVAAVPMRLAVSKMRIEMPILDVTGSKKGRAAVSPASWTPPGDDDWARIAHRPSLSAATLSLLGDENPDANHPAMVEQLVQSVGEDSARNLYSMQPVARAWLAAGSYDLETLNRRVYDELFLTPQSDPYLGLVDAEVYTGLEAGGWQ